MGYFTHALAVSFILSLSFGVSPAKADPPPQTAKPATAKPVEEKKTLQYFIQTTLQNTFDELKLGLPERKVFDNEVQIDGLTFVSTYKATSDGTDVQVDRDKLKNFVKFQSTAFAVSAPASQVCVLVRALPECEACEAWREQLQTAVMGRLERRGFSARAMSALSEEYSLTGDAAADDVVTRSGEEQCGGVFFAEIGQERAADAPDPEESATGDTRVRIFSTLVLRDRNQNKIRGRGQVIAVIGKDVKPNLLSIVATRSTADAFAKTMAKAQSEGGATKMFSGVDKYLRIENVSKFEFYEQIKRKLVSAYPEAKIEERFMTPAVVTFQVESLGSWSDVARVLKAVDLGGGRLEILQAGTDEMTVAIR